MSNTDQKQSSSTIGAQLKVNVDEWNWKQGENILEKVKTKLIEASKKGKKHQRVKLRLKPSECIFLADNWLFFAGVLLGQEIDVVSPRYIPVIDCKCCEFFDLNSEPLAGPCVIELGLKW